MTIGRVAAGAIAEKYLKDALGVEFVAFVSSVGKVHIPATKASTSQSNGTADDDENDESDELLSEEYLNLMNTITREQVDESQVRCPDPATTERMVKASQVMTASRSSLIDDVSCSASSEQRTTTTR